MSDSATTTSAGARSVQDWIDERPQWPDGLALGCDYPTAHMIISESIPSLSRAKLVLGVFAFQAIGAVPAPPSATAHSRPCRSSRPGAGARHELLPADQLRIRDGVDG